MCDYPSLAYRTGIINAETGKEKIKFVSRIDLSYEEAKEKYGDRLLLLPCGSCPSCMKSYASSWSNRLMAESLYHEKSCFLTLTYDDEHLPKKKVISEDGVVQILHPLVKKDLQDFFKRLRKSLSVSIRYFACGEYGDNLAKVDYGLSEGRPHYHVILFGYDFEDKKIIHWNKLGQPLYSSKTLEKLWSNGLVSVGEVSPQSCNYVSRYSLKKRIKHLRSDEFVLMSRRPGIGQQYFFDKKDVLYLSDRMYNARFGSSKLPRYFDNLAEKDVDLSTIFDDVKKSRERKAKGFEYLNMIHLGMDDVGRANAEVLNNKLGHLKV